MKKISYYFVSLLALAMTVIACTPKEDPTPVPAGDGFKLNEVVAAAAEAYSTWEDEREIPASFTVAGKTLSASEFLFAEATALVEISESKADDIKVVTYKAAAAPDKDSYDATEIAVVNGPKDGKGVAEDIVTVAKTFLADAAAKGQWQNRVLVYRGEDALAFCTNRATVTIMRTLATYAETSKLEGKVSTEYLSASNTLKAFAQEFVKYLPIWENTVADKLSADGSHCTANNSAWERVHFIPIPYDTDNDYHNEGKDQYDFQKYGNPMQIEVNGVTYTAANCWEIAIRGLMDMCTVEGQAFLETMGRNTEMTFGDGLSLMSAPISRPSEACVWGKYPWYESTNDTGPVKLDGEAITECGVDLIIKCGSWHVTRSFIKNANNDPLGMIGNFQVFGTDPGASIVYGGYEGQICPMREFLVLARIYKYILDNNINKNVYTAIKDVKFDYDLYNQQLPVNVKTKSVTFEATPEGPETIELTATENWTATCDAEWITLDPASGAAGDATVSVTAQNNTASEARTATITFAAGDYTKDVAVTQTEYIAPITGTLKEFAQEFVKALDVWNATVGIVDADGNHNQGKGTEWQNVHLIPIEHPNATYVGAGYEGNQYDDTLYPTKFTVTVDGQTYTSAQAWEIAQRGMLDLVTAEGSAELVNFNDSRNHAMTLANGAALTEALPAYTPGCAWGANPWYELDNGVTYNGGEIESVGVDFMVKVGAWHVVRSFVKTDCNTSPLGTVGNFQEFGTSSSTLNLDGYVGLIPPMREFLVLARFYKYLLDNNIDNNVYDAVKDVKFDFDLYNQGAAPVKETTIKDFATEYVKLLGVWDKTTGKINTITGFDTQSGNYDPANDVIGHYIPEDTKITVGKKEYNLADVYELAERCYLLVRGYDGNDVNPDHVGAGKIDKLEKSVNMSETEIPATHDYQWASLRYNESAGNGGNFQKKDGSAVASLAVLDNNANRSVNWPLNPSKGNGQISNNCGYNSDQVPGFKGCFSAVRAMLTYAEFFKYMLDNNLDTAGELSADTEVPTRLFGETQPVPTTETFVDFAKKYVTCLDVWASTTGTIFCDGDYPQGRPNVHYIPTKTTGGYDESDNNKGDEFTVTFNGETYTLPQCYVIAANGWLQMMTVEKGTLDPSTFTEKGPNSYTLGNGTDFSKVTLPEMKAWMKTWQYPWYEKGSGGDLGPFNATEVENVFFREALPWHLYRSSANGKVTNWQRFGASGDACHNSEVYSGYACAMRINLALARFYKTLIEKNVDANVYDAMKDVKVSADLYGVE